MNRRTLGMALLSIASSGCLGIYGEFGVTSTPGLKYNELPTSTSGPKNTEISGGTTIGLSAGIDFDVNRKQRWVPILGNSFSSTTFDGGSSKLQSGGLRFDFNLASLSDDLKFRMGLGFELGNGTSTVAATAPGGAAVTLEDKSLGRKAFAGVGLAYYLGGHLVIHGFVGPELLVQDVNGGTIGGFGYAGKIGVSWVFGNSLKDASFLVPMSGSTDITPALEGGANDLGCKVDRTRRDSYAFLTATCDGKEISYLQGSSSMFVTCEHSSEDSCRALSTRIVDAGKKWLERRKREGTKSESPTPSGPATSAPSAAPSATPPAPAAPSSSAPPASSAEPTRTE